MQRIKDDLRQMRLGRALFVGDAGLYAKANLAELGRGAGRYILATPIGRVKEIKDEVLSRPGRYAEITPNLRAKEVIVGAGRAAPALHPVPERRGGRAGEAPSPGDSSSCCRLELDRLGSDHPKAACRLVASKRFGPYLSLDDQGRPFVDRAKVRRAEQLDGKFVLTTNDDTLSAADIALGYKGMWIIEALLPQDEDHRARHPADVPLDAAADRRPRQALRARPDDPARGRDRAPRRRGRSSWTSSSA